MNLAIRLGLRARLYLVSAAILALFAFNVATHLWGSYARSESVIAYRDANVATTLIRDLDQRLARQHQEVQVLAALQDTTDLPLAEDERIKADEDLKAISKDVRQLGGLGDSETEPTYRDLNTHTSALVTRWHNFYESYNDRNATPDVSAQSGFNLTISSLAKLAQRQTEVAVARSAVIDNTIRLTDRITIIAFISSITITMLLVLTLIRSTNNSLLRLKTGAERFGSGDLTHRIDPRKDAGEIADLAHTFNEMSARLQRAMGEVNNAKAEADRANDAKSLFVAKVSHELRTPLNLIIGYSEMLQDVLSDDEQIDRDQSIRDLSTIVSSGQQLLTLINDILDLSKIETGKMLVSRAPCNPADLVAQVCDTLSPLIDQKDNVLKLNIAPSARVEVVTDPGKLQQIVTNLLSNACKFTKSGIIRVSISITSGKIKLIVADTGIGMNETQQAKIFEAFVQAEDLTSANYGGTGLGLTIVQELCNILDGQIFLTSTLNQGSKFVVTLPAVKPISDPLKNEAMSYEHAEI